MTAVTARLPRGRPLPRTSNEGAALPEVDAEGLGEVVVESPSRAVRLASSTKLALTDALVHEAGLELAPETKLTAAHCKS
jgi:hypothetical protein